MPRGLKISTDPSQWGFKDKNYLFTIGIEKYEHWKSLRNAVKDVDDITEIFWVTNASDIDPHETLFFRDLN